MANPIYKHLEINGKTKSIHRLIAEKAIGHELPLTCPVHHYDEDSLNNANSNLVICEDQTYHKLLHIRAKVFRAGFDPDLYKWCSRCETFKLQSEFSKSKGAHDGLYSMCQDCDRKRCAKNKLRRSSEVKAEMAKRRKERESDPTRRLAISEYAKEYRLLHPRKGH